jgi:hypothetical protein
MTQAKTFRNLCRYRGAELHRDHECLNRRFQSGQLGDFFDLFEGRGADAARGAVLEDQDRSRLRGLNRFIKIGEGLEGTHQ